MDAGARSPSASAMRPFKRRLPVWVVASVVLVTGVASATTAGGFLLLRGPGPSPYYVNMTEIDWIDQQGNVLGVSPGVNVSQGQAFSTSVTLRCPQLSVVCNGSAHVSFVSAMGLGNWPPGVSPCGWYRAPFEMTASNLPLVVPSNGSSVVLMTLVAPEMNSPTLPYNNGTYDFTGWLDVELQAASG